MSLSDTAPDSDNDFRGITGHRRFLLALIASLLMHLLLLVDPVGFWPTPTALPVAPPATSLTASETLRAVLRPPSPTRSPTRPAARRPVVPLPAAALAPSAMSSAPTPPPSAATPLAAAATGATPSSEPAPAEPIPPSSAVSSSDVPPETPVAPEVATPVLAPRLAATLSFSVTRGDDGFVVGEATHQLQIADGQYRLSAHLATTGLAALFRPARASQLSIGRYQNGVLTPLTFRNERQSETEEVHFDWPAGRLHLADGRSLALPEGTQDLLSLFYQLAHESASAIDLPVATTRKLERRRFENLGQVRLETPFGERWAQHWRMDATEVWIDSEARLPIKIRLVDHRGDIYQQRIEALNIDTGEMP